ncbi:MAG: MarR family transcriptional regulator [Oscillospiraceae bacterium]|nr:MarR family transcriptional regulator [Oscillospiraceae bacterium]
MDLRDSLNRYYYDMTVGDLIQLNRTGGGELSYNSMMYLDVISYQQMQGGCTASTLAATLHITKPAATMKVNELVKTGLVVKTRSEKDRRVIYLTVSPVVAEALRAYDRPFERAAQAVEKQFTKEEIEVFCHILDAFSAEFMKGFSYGTAGKII